MALCDDCAKSNAVCVEYTTTVVYRVWLDTDDDEVIAVKKAIEMPVDDAVVQDEVDNENAVFLCTKCLGNHDWS